MKKNTNTLTPQQFEDDVYKLFDYCIEQTSIRDGFEHWITLLLYGAIRKIEESKGFTDAQIMTLASEYRLKLENEVKRQTLETLEQLKDEDNKRIVIDYYNRHVEHADYIVLV